MKKGSFACEKIANLFVRGVKGQTINFSDVLSAESLVSDLFQAFTDREGIPEENLRMIFGGK